MRKRYFKPVAEKLSVKALELMATNSLIYGEIYGPDQGDDLDSPDQDYYEP